VAAAFDQVAVGERRSLRNIGTGGAPRQPVRPETGYSMDARLYGERQHPERRTALDAVMRGWTLGRAEAGWAERFLAGRPKKRSSPEALRK